MSDKLLFFGFFLHLIYLHFKLNSPLKENAPEKQIVFYEINPDITHLHHLAKSCAIGATGSDRKILGNINDFLSTISLQQLSGFL